MFTWFSKTGVPQKNHKRQYGLIHVALPQKFIQSLKGITVWPIFQKLMLFSISNTFKKLNWRQQISTHIVLKYYLHYKMITFQNVSSEAQVKDVFISEKSYVPFSWYSSFCIFVHSMIYQICDIMMNIGTWDRVHFWIYLLNCNSLSHQTWPIDRY